MVLCGHPNIHQHSCVRLLHPPGTMHCENNCPAPGTRDDLSQPRRCPPAHAAEGLRRLRRGAFRFTGPSTALEVRRRRPSTAVAAKRSPGDGELEACHRSTHRGGVAQERAVRLQVRRGDGHRRGHAIGAGQCHRRIARSGGRTPAVRQGDCDPRRGRVRHGSQGRVAGAGRR